MAALTTDDFPDELQDRLSSFDDTVAHLEEALKPLHDVPIHQIHGEVRIWTIE